MSCKPVLVEVLGVSDDTFGSIVLLAVSLVVVLFNTSVFLDMVRFTRRTNFPSALRKISPIGGVEDNMSPAAVLALLAIKLFARRITFFPSGRMIISPSNFRSPTTVADPDSVGLLLPLESCRNIPSANALSVLWCRRTRRTFLPSGRIYISPNCAFILLLFTVLLLLLLLLLPSIDDVWDDAPIDRFDPVPGKPFSTLDDVDRIEEERRILRTFLPSALI